MEKKPKDLITPIGTFVQVINGGIGCLSANGKIGIVTTKPITDKNYSGEHFELDADVYVTTGDQCYGLCRGYVIKELRLLDMLELIERQHEALKAISTNEHLGDMIYQVRDREGNGWEGESVTKWSNAIQQIESVLSAYEKLFEDHGIRNLY